MATSTTIHVQTEDAGGVLSILENYLRRGWNTGQISRRTSDGSGEIYGEAFLCSADDPTMFAFGRGQNGWVMIHYNSFSDCRHLVEKISCQLRCLVVLIMAQSVSSAYHITVCRDGEHLRTLEFADGEWVKNFGKPFPFEKEPLGHNIGTPDEPFYDFDEKDMTEYCKNFGLNPWADEVAEEWTILSAS